MTVIDQAVRPAVQPSAARPSSGRSTCAGTRHRRTEGRDAYLLRLSLDLQLDALLLVLGASATGRDASDIPWRRWLDEDVELAWELTATARSAQAALPVTLGTSLDDEDSDGVHADLLARYESMCRLLEDLLAAEAPSDKAEDTTLDLSGAAPRVAATAAAADDVPAWHSHVRAALDRCRTRVAELTAHAGAPAKAAAAAAAGLSGIGRERLGSRGSFLPGELLG